MNKKKSKQVEATAFAAPTSSRFNIMLSSTPPWGAGHMLGGGPFEANTRRTVEAVPYPGWQFDGWFDFTTGRLESHNSLHEFTLVQNVHLMARFSESSGGWNPPPPPVGFQVTVTAAQGGTATGTGRFNPNTQATVRATPNFGWQFDGWFENNQRVSNIEEWRFQVTGNRTLQARFTLRQRTVTVFTVIGNGTVAGGTTVEHGTQVTIIATPDVGWQFDGWFEGETRVSTAAQWQFALTDDRVLEARFSRQQFTVTVLDATGGTVTGQGLTNNGGILRGLFNHGATVTLTATPTPVSDPSWQFRGMGSGGMAVTASAGGAFAGSRLYSLPATAVGFRMAYAYQTPPQHGISQYYPMRMWKRGLFKYPAT